MSDEYKEDIIDDEVEIEVVNNPEINDNLDEMPKDKVFLMWEFIRERSYEGLLTNAEDFLDDPLSFEVDEILTLIKELEEREECSDICITKGKEKIYLYSEEYITNNYAKMMISVDEKDMFKTIAETVREESKLYPRPTDIRLFSHAPFKFSSKDFYEVYAQLKKKEEYKDIQETRASNNALYLYSNKYMKHAHAASLAEWIEVGAEQNP